MPKEIINLSTLEMIDDILKRLYTIENCLMSMTVVIDIANDYEKRLTKLEKEKRPMPSTLNRDTKNLINHYYKEFTKIIQGTNIADTFKSNAILYLECARRWLTEGQKMSQLVDELESKYHGKIEESKKRNQEGQNQVSTEIPSSQI